MDIENEWIRDMFINMANKKYNDEKRKFIEEYYYMISIT